MLTRRRFLQATLALGATACAPRTRQLDEGSWVNDVHAQLSATRVARIQRVESTHAVVRAVRSARVEGRAVCVAGGRHAMGGQAFGTDAALLDTTGLARIIGFDHERGLVEVEAGIQWPALVDFLVDVQRGQARQWGIVQKQTGADRLSLGGALAANVHGRGLRFRPIIADVESFVLVDAEGTIRRVSRTDNPELFALVIGGYGLLGVVTSVTLRLAPRRKLRRVVELLDVESLGPALEQRLADGFLFGDFQYATDPASDDFLRRGVFSCYQPIDDVTPMPADQKELSTADWDRLLLLSHADKRQAFQAYASYYLSTSGQLYWSDLHQMSVYVDDYHRALDLRLGATDRATEMITEIYVPRPALPRFLGDVREDFRAHQVNLIYGTIRLIERDGESQLAWARESWACVIFNLHVVHTPAGLAGAGEAFRRLIDHGLRYGGSYYLTYHRWATRRQVEAAHPRFVEFLQAKRRHDPQERFQSDWYRHYRALFADAL